MDSSALYKRKIEEANPQFATETKEGTKLTIQESSFIYNYILTGNAIDSFLKAGFTYPRRPITAEERELGVMDTLKKPASAENKKRKIEDKQKEINIEEKQTITNNSNVNIIDTEKSDEYMTANYLTADYLTAVRKSAHDLLYRPDIKHELQLRLQALQDAETADAGEVLRYFTAVMRGQVLDQFGLEASLQERTRAAECLAKRLIDMPKKMEASGTVNGNPIKLVIQTRADDGDEEIEGGSYEEIG